MASFIADVFEADVFEDAIFTGVNTDVVKEFEVLNKVIRLKAGITTYHPIDDLYKEMRYHRKHDESLRVKDVPINAEGNLPKGGGEFTGRLAVFKDGWIVIPADSPTNPNITITGEQIDGLGLKGLDLVDTTGLVNNINMSYVPPPATEVIIVETSTGGLTVAQDEILSRTAYIEARVYVDTEALVNGDGSQVSPFNVFNDAKDYAEANGIYVLVIHGEITIVSDFKNFTVYGIGVPVINTNGQDLKNSKFFQCEMRGTYLDTIVVQEGILANGFELNGYFEKCMLGGDLVCVANAIVLVVNCFSGIAGLGRPTISMNTGTPTKLSVRNYSGGLTITDSDHINDEATIEMSQGSLTFDSSCTNGTMVARGIGKFVDETAGATVVDEMVNDVATVFDVMNATQI